MKKTLATLTTIGMLYTSMPVQAGDNDSYKFEDLNKNYSLPVTIELAQASPSGDLSKGLEGKVSVNVTEIARQSKEHGFWNTIKNIGVVLSSPVRPNQWKTHPYRTSAVTTAYVVGIAAAASGGGSSGGSTPAIQEPVTPTPVVNNDDDDDSDDSGDDYQAPEPEPVDDGGTPGGDVF